MTLDGTSLGSIAMYSCNTGFKLDGPETLTCANDGTWSGQPPTCSESKQCHEYLYSLIDIFYILCIVNCPNLDNPDNGFVTLDGTSLGSIAIYSCNTGFKFDGPEMLTCARDGTWSSQPPTCSESKQYYEPFIISHNHGYM